MNEYDQLLDYLEEFIKKPKPVTEKQSELIGLRFTISELEQIKAKAWLIPIATFIKNELQTKTDILD